MVNQSGNAFVIAVLDLGAGGMLPLPRCVGDFWITGEVNISPFCSVIPRCKQSLDIVCAIDVLLTSCGVRAQKKFAKLCSGRILTGI